MRTRAAIASLSAGVPRVGAGCAEAARLMAMAATVMITRCVRRVRFVMEELFQFFDPPAFFARSMISKEELCDRGHREVEAVRLQRERSESVFEVKVSRAELRIHDHSP